MDRQRAWGALGVVHRLRERAQQDRREVAAVRAASRTPARGDVGGEQRLAVSLPAVPRRVLDAPDGSVAIEHSIHATASISVGRETGRAASRWPTSPMKAAVLPEL
jgi:hypothetical protein